VRRQGLARDNTGDKARAFLAARRQAWFAVVGRSHGNRCHRIVDRPAALIAAFLALQIATASRRVAWFPLALAILLVGIRQSYSLYNKLAFGQPIDLGAEVVALVISTLMLVGLFGLRRCQPSAFSSFLRPPKPSLARPR
jgi:hypothetical protein